MKVLLAHFKIEDWGGIINYSEFLARGLKNIGHDVGSVMLKNKGKTGINTNKINDHPESDGWEYGSGLDLWMHQKFGWRGMYQLNYTTDVVSGKSWTDDYDLVIYIVPAVPCTKSNKDDDNWLKLFSNSSAKQLAVVHDANMQKLYPHILNICDYLNGIICVHDAAYNSCEVLPVRRKLIPNPHDTYPMEDIVEIRDRIDGFVSMQTFKRWKRVDDLIRAILHMDYFHEKIICGGGIEYRYMTSENKCKAIYKDKYGERIWDKAVKSGMDFRGYISTIERDKILKNIKLLIDPSWSINYSKLGAHFNRVMIEAMSWGCVPVCTDLGMKNSYYFKPGVNYIEIPYDIHPRGYANIVDEALENTYLLQRIQETNLEMMSIFDKNNVAKKIIKFAADDSGEVGKATDKLIAAADRKMQHFGEEW